MLNDQWQKSTKSDPNANCVEAREVGGVIEVRNSKSPEAGTATFTRPEWIAFLEGAQDGEFDVA